MIPSGMYRADAAQEEGAFGGTGGLAVNTSHVQPGGYGGISATDGDPASQGSASYEMSWQQLQQREAQVQQRIRELLNDPSMQQHLHSEPVQWDAGMDQPSRIPSTTDAQCFIHGGPLSKSPLSVLDYGKAPGVGMSVLASSMDPSQPYHDKQNSSQQYAGQTWHGGFVGNAVEERFMPSEKLMHQAEGHHQVAESSSNIERPEDPVTMIDPSLLLSAEEVARLQPSDARNYYAALEEVRRQSAVESSGLDDNGIDEGRVGANIHEGKAQSYPGYFSQLALRLQGRGRYFMDRLAVSISQAAPILKNVSKVLLSSEDSALRAADVCTQPTRTVTRTPLLIERAIVLTGNWRNAQLDGSSAHEPRPGLHTVEPIQLGSKFRSTKRRLENSKPKTPAAPRLTLSTVYSELGIRMKGHTGLMTALMMCMFLVLIGAIRFMFRGGFLVRPTCLDRQEALPVLIGARMAGRHSPHSIQLISRIDCKLQIPNEAAEVPIVLRTLRDHVRANGSCLVTFAAQGSTQTPHRRANKQRERCVNGLMHAESLWEGCRS
eukprot:scaffold1535_cov382-Prasinococcus_capsulatus_cf.AAC.20